VITLDPAQAAALRSAATDPIIVTGTDGTGKSTLAMAIPLLFESDRVVACARNDAIGRKRP